LVGQRVHVPTCIGGHRRLVRTGYHAKTGQQREKQVKKGKPGHHPMVVIVTFVTNAASKPGSSLFDRCRTAAKFDCLVRRTGWQAAAYPSKMARQTRLLGSNADDSYPAAGGYRA
jgi:hypothetical protein